MWKGNSCYPGSTPPVIGLNFSSNVLPYSACLPESKCVMETCLSWSGGALRITASQFLPYGLLLPASSSTSHKLVTSVSWSLRILFPWPNQRWGLQDCCSIRTLKILPIETLKCVLQYDIIRYFVANSIQTKVIPKSKLIFSYSLLASKILD